MAVLTVRSVPQLVAAEENRTSCQPSGRHSTFALRVAVHFLWIATVKFQFRSADCCDRFGFFGLCFLNVNGKIVGRRLGWLTPTSYITRTRATTAVIGERKVTPPFSIHTYTYKCMCQ